MLCDIYFVNDYFSTLLHKRELLINPILELNIQQYLLIKKKCRLRLTPISVNKSIVVPPYPREFDFVVFRG